MPAHHIYIYGVICSDQSTFANEFGCVSLRSVNDQILAAPKGTDEIVAHLHGPGGDVIEGFAIHDRLINTGLDITTIIEGQCASILTVVALAGSKRVMGSNSEFFIHNPWGWAEGDAEELREYADQVEAAEEKLLDFYVEKTGADRDALAALMDAETTFTAEQAMELGFITEISEQVQAVALYSPNTFFKTGAMSTPAQKAAAKKAAEKKAAEAKAAEAKKKLAAKKAAEAKAAAAKKAAAEKDPLQASKDILERLKKHTKPGAKAEAGAVVDLDVALEDGTTLVVETTADAPAIGDYCTVDGEMAPDGEYVMADTGDTIVIESGDGTITDIRPADNTAAEDVAALIEANEALQARVEELEAERAEQAELNSQINAKLDQILKGTSSQYKPKARNPQFAKPNAGDEPETPAAKALARRKAEREAAAKKAAEKK